MANHEFRSDGVGGPGDKGNADDARGALQDLESVRARFGHRLATPWWYKAASALIIAALFIGAGMPYESISFGSSSTGASLLVLAVILGPPFLRDLLKRSTGASFDRYRNGWTVPSFALIGLLVYGTYDLTNMATLRHWSLRLALVDIAWGTLVSAAAGAAAFAATRP